MPYRPFSHNEKILVKRKMQSTRGTSGSVADHMIEIYERAAALEDASAFDVFLRCEKEYQKEQSENQPLDFSDLKHEDPNFLKKLAEKLEPHQVPKSRSTADWLFGDTKLLDADSRRLRTLFFNSKRYRKIVLDFYIHEGFLSESDDFDTIEQVLRDFETQYPATRMGLISLYEIYFGDPSPFSYSLAKKRRALFNDPDEKRRILEFYHLPLNWEIEDLKSYLLTTALESGSLKQSDLDAWEGKTWDY